MPLVEHRSGPGFRVELVDPLSPDLCGASLQSVARISEPDRAIGADREVVGRIEFLSLEFVGEDRNLTPRVGQNHVAPAVLAGEEVALQIEEVAVGRLHLAIFLQSTGRAPLHLEAVRDIAEDDHLLGGDPDRSLGEFHLTAQFHHLGPGCHDLLTGFVVICRSGQNEGGSEERQGEIGFNSGGFWPQSKFPHKLKKEAPQCGVLHDQFSELGLLRPRNDRYFLE